MSELLKNAIADAKAVRATALANAKAALEEAFTPKLQSMLSAKLSEEAEGDEEMEGMHPEDHHEEGEMDETHMEESNLEEVEMDETVDPQGQGEEVKKGAKKDDKDLTTDLSGTELVDKSKLKTTTKDPQGQGDEVSDGSKKDDKNLTPDLKAESAMSHSDEDLEEVINELEAEVADSEEDMMPGEKKMGDEEMCEHDTEQGGEGDGDVEIDVDMDHDHSGDSEASEKSAVEAGDDKSEEELDLEEILKELDGKQEESVVGESEELDEVKSKVTQLQTENDEYRKALEVLHTQLNEVNLLNAKLLYTNKLFKAYTLSNSQKMKVVESFDLTKSVREVKLIYATLAESFNFGGASKKGTIAEGLASKPVASTKPVKTEILSEGTEMANRFKKLAGIKAKK